MEDVKSESFSPEFLIQFLCQECGGLPIKPVQCNRCEAMYCQRCVPKFKKKEPKAEEAKVPTAEGEEEKGGDAPAERVEKEPEALAGDKNEGASPQNDEIDYVKAVEELIQKSPKCLVSEC